MIKLFQGGEFAPGCFIVARERADGTFDPRDEPNTVLVQTDWDWPGIASTFGWSIATVQAPAGPYSPLPREDGEDGPIVELPVESCDHSGTDGTVDCPECGLKALDFITAAGAWLREHDGAVAYDPGYFQ